LKKCKYEHDDVVKKIDTKGASKMVVRADGLNTKESQ